MQERELDRVKEDVESLTVHGIPRAISAKSKCARILWLSLSILAVLGLSTTVFKSLSGYFRREITIKTTLRQNRVLPLPAITFCNTKYVFDYFKSVPSLQSFPKNCSSKGDMHFSNEANNISFNIGCQMFFGEVSAELFLINQIAEKTFRFPDNFTFVPNRYPCFTFNRNSLSVQKAEGEENGIKILLYNTEFKGPRFHHTSGSVRDETRGISVWLHDPNQKIPFGDRVTLLPGFQTHISVRKNIVKKKQHPYPSKCSESGPDQSSIYPGKNIMRMCYASCFYKAMYKLCHGVMPSVRAFMHAPEYPIHDNSARFWACLTGNQSSIDYTKCECRPHCYEEVYKLTVSRSTWPQNWQTRSFARLIKGVEEKELNLSAEEIRDRLIKVVIYYEDFMETIYEEIPLYNILSIVSDLGGQMGLFLGASLLSLAEIVALMIGVMKRKLFGKAGVSES